MKRRIFSMLLAATMTMGLLAGCGNETTETTQGQVDKQETTQASEVTSESETKVVDKDKLPTISLFPANANLASGLVSGHKGDFFAENGFQLEVWAHSPEKKNAILSSGDLPDIMYVKKADLEVMIEAGMILNLDDYLDQMPNAYNCQWMDEAMDAIRDGYSNGTGNLYAMPTSVGDVNTKYAWADSTNRNCVKLRWDIYEEIGAPEIKDFWDLIDVMEQMLKAHPEEEDGTVCYGTVLNSGSDGGYWGNMELWYKWQGYETSNLDCFVEKNMVTGEYSSILSEDSKYYEGLKWYNEVYRRGLMDPDSINIDRSTQAPKIDAGLAMVPSGTLPGWAPIYLEYYIPDTSLYFAYTSKTGGGEVLVINAETEHLEECIKFLDMMCTTDTYLRLNYGPEGDLWYAEGENVYLTQRSIDWLTENGKINGITMIDGTEWAIWNTPMCVQTGELTSYKDGNGNYRIPILYRWDEAQAITTNSENFKNWQETTGYNKWSEWLAAENAFHSSGPIDDIAGYMTATMDANQELIRGTVNDKVVTASWQMVYAETEAEFDAIWEQLLADCEGLGVEELIEWQLNEFELAKARMAEANK